MRGIDHLVIAGRDLDAMRLAYAQLGFTLTSRALHPFGTGNSLVQLDNCFLEILSVVEPDRIVQPTRENFSFGAFNRDFLDRHEGVSMLVLDSRDARADQQAFKAAGLDTYEPFDFSRKATLPDGEQVTVGFSLAFATNPQMPRSGFFTCQQHAPQYFWRPEYQKHPNSACTIEEVCLVAHDPRKLRPFLTGFTGVEPEKNCFRTSRGTLLVLRPREFEMRYGMRSPAMDEGARFAGFTVGVADLGFVNGLGLKRAGIRLVKDLFGTAIAFSRVKRQ